MRLPLGLYRVEGLSMLPTYRSGDTLLGWRNPVPKVGQVVVLDRGRFVIKRITRIEPDGLWVEGDNPAASTDSRQFGLVDPHLVVATIIAKL